MEAFVTSLFESGLASWGGALALALCAIGLPLRRQGRLREARLARQRAARSDLGAVGPGAVTVEGRWRALDGAGCRGLIESGSGARADRVVVERDLPFRLRDGDHVTLSGYVSRRRPLDEGGLGGYRESAAHWVLDARGADELCLTGVDALDRAAAAASRRARAGAALFASGLGLLVLLAVLSLRYDG